MILDDSIIINLFFERSEQAITELSAKYGHVVLRVAENILNNQQDSEEIVNDAYLGVWNSVPPKRPDPLLTYVCRIVRNLAINRYHEKTSLKRNSAYDIALDEISDCFPSSVSVEDTVETNEITLKVNEFLKALDSDSRIMFVRRYWYADSIDDIAVSFNRSSHYISVKLSRIRKSLRKYLISEGAYI